MGRMKKGYKHNKTLPCSARDMPSAHPFTNREMFLREAGINSERAGLRILAD